MKIPLSKIYKYVLKTQNIHLKFKIQIKINYINSSVIERNLYLYTVLDILYYLI